jgi:hypothetical protein
MSKTSLKPRGSKPTPAGRPSGSPLGALAKGMASDLRMVTVLTERARATRGETALLAMVAPKERTGRAALTKAHMAGDGHEREGEYVEIDEYFVSVAGGAQWVSEGAVCTYIYEVSGEGVVMIFRDELEG